MILHLLVMILAMFGRFVLFHRRLVSVLLGMKIIRRAFSSFSLAIGFSPSYAAVCIYMCIL